MIAVYFEQRAVTGTSYERQPVDELLAAHPIAGPDDGSPDARARTDAGQDGASIDTPGATATTLGDVLYADKSLSAPPERDWVALVLRVAHGDQIALHALYERAHRPVFTLAMRISGNRESAEEVTLDVFHDVWRRAGRYDAVNGTVLGWIMNLARSRAIDRIRFDGRKKRADPFASDIAAEPESPDSQQILMAKQEAHALRSALAILSADERRVIEAAFFSDLTYAEVAARFDEPLGTVKTRIRSGLVKLRRALSTEVPKR